jgi:tetratricopeptide (TPR) repeat protein
MRRLPIILSLAALLMSSQSGYCDSFYQLGVKSYTKGDTRGAIVLLEAALRGGSEKNPEAHYLLGSCYYKMNRPADALKQYQSSLALNSKSKTADFCRSAIQAIKNEQADAAAAVHGNAKTVKVDKGLPAIKVDDSAVVAALPSVPSINTERPSSFEVNQWTDPLRAQFLNQAISRVPQLQEKLRAAQDLLKQAQTCTNDLVNPPKKKGEDAGTYKRRAQAGQTRANQLLRPYEEYVSSCQKAVNDAKTVVEACRVADKKLNR